MILWNLGEHVREVQQREHGNILSAEAYYQGPTIWAEQGRQPGVYKVSGTRRLP